MSGIYKNGKEIAKNLRGPSRMEFIGAFLGDLFKSLDSCNQELSLISIPNDLHDLMTDYADYVLKFLRSYPEPTGRVAKKSIGLVRALNLKQVLFEKAFRSFDDIPPEVNQVVFEFNESVRWFVEQHMKAFYSYIPGQKLPIKPSDWEGRKVFEREVMEHQIIHGERKYPRYKNIQKIMKKEGFKLSERSYRDWKRLYENGELWSYFPNKNRQ